MCRLEALRGRIDAVDATLVQTIADRLAVAREIGAVKRAVGLPVVNVEREAVVIAGFVEKTRARGISEENGTGRDLEPDRCGSCGAVRPDSVSSTSSLWPQIGDLRRVSDSG